ncbi:MAG: fasciclin domain-containing protein, partial [Flavobacteriales bacterium]|nr:fasciclin domain-containing protein [Flavobacteriales bacterium]
MKKLLLTLTLIASFCMGAFSDNHTVYAGMFFYNPAELTIEIGDTVTWINDGGMHDVNANIDSQTGESFNNPESFQSSVITGMGDVIYTHVFSIDGTYNYDCSVPGHAAQGMVGQINVELPSIMDIVANSDAHNTLEAAINAAGLNETLDTGGPFTLFAPTDEAFA